MNIFTSSRRLLAATLFFVASGFPASAQTVVSPATFEINQLGESYAFYSIPGTYSSNYGSTTVSTNPFTLISVRSTGDPSGSVTSNNAFVNYFFMMQGANGRVAATFMADLFVSMSDLPKDENSLARSYYSLSSVGGGNFYDRNGSVLNIGPSKDLRRSGPGSGRLSKPDTFMVDANVMYKVSLFAGAQTGTRGLLATAYLDPAITISPAQQSSYTLLLSPDISNLLPTAPTTVPEPASVALVGSGLLGIAVLLRRQRAKG